ncbi:MAG TPA: undecaprenyldiphospho-muramoylpentapeptide beta-N-acetylglucosaminyltransferase, partial [Thermoanaerobaculia bacterium]|nr:undecaprenyldiphospho-muramoylpentapeptide beta-N-acetylglucosaminyltransferase [Thermoanaerobaculia bacterium]
MANPASPLHVLLAGGGTGGHVFPALAVGEELQARGWRGSFTGSTAGLEERLVTQRDLPFHPLPARPLVGRGPVGKARALTTMMSSGVAASGLIKKIGAHVVLGTGGYVSAPAVLGARLARRPVMLLEPNGKAGVANRWLSRWATVAAVGYREAIADLKCPCVVTGVPVRAAFFAVPGDLPAIGAPRLLVLGGSQGARQINETLPAAAARLIERFPTLHITHQAGAKNLDDARAAYERAGVGATHVEVVPFLEDVAGAMAASHLLVSRAGAITLAEICAAGRPSLLVPLAIAQGHQVDNARVLVDAGGAEMIPSDRFSAEGLA